jgi:hypothetical protein
LQWVPNARGQAISVPSDFHPHIAPGRPTASASELGQQTENVFRKAQDALGGLRRLQAIHDVTRKVEMVNLATKERAQATSEIIFPEVIRLTTDSPFGELVAFSDGHSAWSSSAFGVDQRLPDWQIKASRQDLFRQLETLLQSDRNPDRKLEFMERGKVEDRPADILKISSEVAGTVRLWVDAVSGDLLELEYQRVVARGSGPLVTDFFSDYRWVNKTIRVPFHIHTLSDGQPYMDTEVVGVEYNRGLKAEILNQKPTLK